MLALLAIDFRHCARLAQRRQPTKTMLPPLPRSRRAVVKLVERPNADHATTKTPQLAVGPWVWDVATKIGITIAANTIKKTVGI
jgi:hypothetical protein